jgi:Fur family transcriptional regulator, zinc uptake regulator
MSAHAHVHHHGDDLANAAKGVLESSGEQWTALRARVFEVLSGYDKPASAYDIAEALSKSEGRRVAANTVYRILDLFVGSNLARKLESANAYVANDHPDCVHDCIFLVCDDCGRATHIDDDAVTARVRGAAEGAGFQAVRPVIEVRGRCEDCA